MKSKNTMFLILVICLFACNGNNFFSKSTNQKIEQLKSIKAFNNNFNFYEEGDTLKVVFQDSSNIVYYSFLDLKYSYMLFVLKDEIMKYKYVYFYTYPYKGTVPILDKSGGAPFYYKKFTRVEANNFVDEAFIQSAKFESITKLILSTSTAEDLKAIDSLISFSNHNLLGFDFTGDFLDLVFLYAKEKEGVSGITYATERLRHIGTTFLIMQNESNYKLINSILTSSGDKQIEIPSEPAFQPNEEFEEQLRKMFEEKNN